MTCSDEEFPCSNGHCILKRWLCDGEDDCKDGSDEHEGSCASKKCSEEQFQCGTSGECIPVNWRCDGNQDCTGGEDEKNCLTATCPPEMFMCNSSNRCITQRWVCDQDKDCDDGSDESECDEAVTCSPGEWKCNSTDRCIPGRWKCDGDADCKDGSDERDCPSRPPAVHDTCSDTEFMCSNFECIHSAWRCDGDPDCADGSDEESCGPVQCEADQFKCDDKQCIHGALQCDGTADCRHGEDELDCAPAKTQCNRESEFDCHGDGKQCIPISKLCDHENDCGAFEDEPSGPNSFCSTPNPCDNNNGGCKHKCNYNTYSHYCSCSPGYELDKDNKTCNDINECLVPGTCSQGCDNVRGGYKCSCLAGYTLDPKGRYCRAGGREPYLLFANRRDLREIRLDSGDYRAIVAETRSAIAIDFDYEDSYVYWSDVAQESILRARYNHSHPAEKHQAQTVVKDLTTPDGIAVDWLHKLIYWTDTGRNTIEVLSLRSNHRMTLFNSDLDEPRAIMVDPRADQGWIYWTDWGSVPKIERAGMNGNQRTPIIMKDLEWPNGMTIDYVSNKLFWVDAKLHIIMSSNLDGTKRSVILSDDHYLRHPFSISVFEDSLYWTDWQTESIHKTNKFNGSAVSNIAISLFSPMDIHVFHELKQPKDQPRCGNNNGGCSHLCLPSPMITPGSALYSCACPDGQELESDGRTCNSPSTIRPTPGDSGDVDTATDKNYGPNSSSGRGGKPVVPSDDSAEVGRMAGIIAGGILGFVLVAVIIGYIIYRSILRKNIQSMNFDNPVYRKTTEDQFSLEKNQFQPSRLPATLEPLTAGQTEEV